MSQPVSWFELCQADYFACAQGVAGQFRPQVLDDDDLAPMWVGELVATADEALAIAKAKVTDLVDDIRYVNEMADLSDG